MLSLFRATGYVYSYLMYRSTVLFLIYQLLALAKQRCANTL